MPTVLREKGFRFFFFSREGNEPPHIHVELGRCVAKFWLNPMKLADAGRFKNHELVKIKAIVLKNRKNFLGEWYAHFGRV